MIVIDGSKGEGGGQILRSSLALSLLTGQAFRLIHIRARRSKPGLQPQHLMSVKAAAQIAGAKVSGAAVNSQTLTFEPAPVKAGDYHFSIGTAGATGLVLHTVYLPLALTGQTSRVVIEGGTHVPHSPCFHFLAATWRGYLKCLGLDIEVKMHRTGFYPRGGGKIEATIRGCKREDLRPLNLGPRESMLPLGLTPQGSPLTPQGSPPQGSPARVTGFSAVAGLPTSIAERQADRASERLNEAGYAADIELQSWPGGPGTVVGLTIATVPAPTLFFALGARGKRAELVADEAVDEALAYLATGGVDNHSADQLLLPLAFASGASDYPISRMTGHVFTNARTVETFVPCRLRCEGTEDTPGRVQLSA